MSLFEKLKTLLTARFFPWRQNQVDEATPTQPASTLEDATGSVESSTTVFVKFDQATSEADRAAAVRTQLNGQIIRWLPEINTCIVKVPSRRVGMTTSLPLPSASAPILHIEPDGVVHGCQSNATPPFNDPELPQAYGLRIIEAIDAWQFTTGEGVVVAVLDTGIDSAHPEFAGRLLPGQNFVDNGDATAADDNGHGTHVAGIIGAALNNAQGAAGAAPNCTILPLKVLDSTNTGTWSNIVTGVLAAIGQNAQVINMSLGADVMPPQALQEAIELASQSAVLVASAGNERSSQEFYPAAYPEVIGVNATTEDETLWPFSNTGPWVTVAAPGDRIFSTARNSSYEIRSGTSMSAAFVSGVAALLLAQNAQLTAAAATDQITTTATPLTDPSTPAGQIGSGRLNAFDAVGGKRVFIPLI